MLIIFALDDQGKTQRWKEIREAFLMHNKTRNILLK